MISVYAKKTEIELNTRRLESIDEYNRIVQWGRANPTRFIEQVFEIQLLDYQKWVFLNTWSSQHAVWVCSRNAGKSFLGALYIMTRSVLFPNFMTYIMSNTSQQAKETFKKMEDIAKKNVSSILGSSDVFLNEIVKTNANGDGFTHDAARHKVGLYNGSTITSLVGKAENIVGIRSNLNFYDEAGKIDANYFALTRPFTTQNMDFKTGQGYDYNVYPPNISNQIIYASSAEGVDTELWKAYVDCAKKMLMGIPGYFCADINCDMPLKPYLNGIEQPPLLRQSEIDSVMRTNEARAIREYYNIFDTSGGSNAAVQRTTILRNEHPYLPEDCSTGPDKHYVITYDPASRFDNSFVLIGECYKDPEKGWKCKVVNGVNLIEWFGPRDKRPLSTPEQSKWLKRLILAYNGTALEYDNIDLYIDAGPGGGGSQMADLLMPDWLDEAGNKHKGLIDEKDENGGKIRRPSFPNAVDCVHMIIPQKYRTQMFSAMSEMMSQDLIDLPITSVTSEGVDRGDGTKVMPTQEELRALTELDLLKEEVMAIQKVKSDNGNITYKLPPDKEKKMHKQHCALVA